MGRPSYLQQEALAEFLIENPELAKGLLRTAYAKQATRRKWEAISVNLNALGGAQKDGKGWAKYWADKKCALKKICSQHNASMKRTGGGPPDTLPPLTPLDQRLVDVLGGITFATGDCNVAINPFPRTNTTDSVPAIPISNVELQLEGEPVEISVQPAVPVADPVQIPISSQQERSPLHAPQIRQRTRSRRLSSNVDQTRQLFAAIERQRVEAESNTAIALREAVDQIPTMATAINNLANAVIEAAQILAQAMVRTHQ